MDTRMYECVLPLEEARWLASPNGPLSGEGCKLGEQRDAQVPVTLDAVAMWILRGWQGGGRVEDEDGPRIVFGRDSWPVREVEPARVT